VTPLAAAERFLAGAPVGGQVDAFVSVDPDAVLRDAAAVTRRTTAFGRGSVMDGLLVGVGDDLHVAGYVTRWGTTCLATDATADAPLVTRLRSAGAVVAGKTRMTELALSAVGVNAAGGSARNPYDRDRAAGGSGSGAGAAVAAGLVPVAVGVDGAGGVRIPAALCGVVGFKPSAARIPLDADAALGWWSLAQPGVVTACVNDAADAYAVLAGTTRPDTRDDTPLHAGVDWRWWGVPVTAVDRACRAAADALAVREVHLDHLELARPAARVTALTEVAAAVGATLDGERDRFAADVQAVLAVASALTAVDYVRAQQVRTLLARAFAVAFAHVDVLVTPATAVTAPTLPAAAWADGLLDEALEVALTAYALPANLLGLPAVTVPVGADADGLPVGLQIIGAAGADANVLRCAAQLERAGVAAPRRIGHALQRREEKEDMS
jgi:Asp-tRNA(Asn)/Glu-tRNA(Gln) amidotransferase A subunit family amidase